MMRQLIVKILKFVGLYLPVRKMYEQFLYKRTYPDVWNLKLDGLEVCYDTTDPYSKSWFYPRYSKGRIHEPITTMLFKQYIKSNSQVLDIGGHLGYFTCLAAKLAHEGNVCVFEVDPKCVNLIEKNVKLNSLTNVEIKNYAISNQSEKIRIPNFENPNPGLRIRTNLKSNFIEVDAIRIDDFISEYNFLPSFIKIDVEGAELKVLQGMKNILKNKDLVLLVEIHVDSLREHFNTDYKEILELLFQNGFTIQNIEHRKNESSFEQLNRSSILKGNTMVLCQK